jgi:hypothetical protein
MPLSTSNDTRPVELTERERLYLMGHLAYKDGIGRDIWDKIRAIPCERPRAQLPLEMK